MLLAQIEGFLEIARQGNMRRAAYTLSISQPALTARLQGLEDELGMALFRRAHSGMVLTPAGRAFLPHADRAIEAIRSGSSLIRELELGVTGELALAVAPAVSAYVLPEILVRFTARHPDVRLLVRTGHSEEIVDLVARGEVDLGIVRQLRDPRVSRRPLYDDELVLVAGGSHHFGDRAFIGLPELAEARLILFDRTSSYYELTNAFFREAGVAPSGVIELDNIDAAKQMVGQGLGIALLPHTSVAAELADGRLRAIDIQGAAPIRRRIVAIRRRDIGPALGPVGAFLEVLADVAAVLPGVAGEDGSPGDRRGRPPGVDRD